MRNAKNKTLAAWLAFLGGPLGIHRFYLHGLLDVFGWLHPIPTALGLWGLERVQRFGQDDVLSWWLLPWLGLGIAAACLAAIVYALEKPERWNRKHNPGLPADHPAGRTSGLTVTAVVGALMLGAIALMSSLAFAFQRYFEHQVAQGLLLSQ
ncbi:MAG TPA: hypothetical protein VFY31_09485 [Macromonas sp.]|nr:hypothetical protein [Macromonas sp.]